jgi:hypothetical protein
MAVPLIPFVAGAVVGGLVAYFYKDENVRREARRAADEVSDVVSHNLDELKHRFRPDSRTTAKKSPELKKKESGATPTKKKKPPNKKAAKKKAAKKKPSAKKRAAKKSTARKKSAARKTSPKDESESP